MYKCIFQGKLTFKDKFSFQKAYDQFVNRSEVFFKNEVVFMAEDVFDEEENALTITRKVVNIQLKHWKNTLELFDYIRQFALSGQIECWMVESGKILEYQIYEPRGDKSVIVNFKEGRILSDQEGREEEAIAKLTKAIDRYGMHSQAYERRGTVNMKLKNYSDARYDFDKSIRLDRQNARAYYGRGNLGLIEKKWEEAVEDFDQAAKNSLAVEPLFWMARRKKVMALLELKKWEEGLKEMKLSINRKFAKDDPNYSSIPQMHTMYVKALIHLGEEHEALDFIQNHLDKADEESSIVKSLITDRGVVRKHLGQKDYLKDWEVAASMGEPRAHRYLEEKR